MGAAIEAAVFGALDKIRIQLEIIGLEKVHISELNGIADSAIQERISAREHSLEALAKHFVQFVEENTPVEKAEESQRPSINIVTLSSSGTTLQCLSTLIRSLADKGQDIKLSVLESRPKFEGVAFINTLLKAFQDDLNIRSRLQVEITSDASISTAIQDAHYLIFGGDKVLPNGNVSNKIGSLVTAVMAKTLNPVCKVVAVFETDKITSSGFDSEHLKVEYNDETEVTSSWSKGCVEDLRKLRGEGYQVEVRNAYFEWVEAKWIDCYISEEGLLTRDDIGRLGRETEELEKRIFGDL